MLFRSPGKNRKPTCRLARIFDTEDGRFWAKKRRFRFFKQALFCSMPFCALRKPESFQAFHTGSCPAPAGAGCYKGAGMAPALPVYHKSFEKERAKAKRNVPLPLLLSVILRQSPAPGHTEGLPPRAWRTSPPSPGCPLWRSRTPRPPGSLRRKGRCGKKRRPAAGSRKNPPR